MLYTNVANFSDHYDGFLLDLWGVIHDGTTVYQGARECLLKLQQQHKQVAFISNTSLTEEQLTQELALLGIDNSCYNLVITAGEVARHLLQTKAQPWVTELGSRYWQTGTNSLLAGLDYQEVTSIEQATFVLNTGTSTSYVPMLKKARILELPMLCPNPDKLIVKSDGTIRSCPGALAEYYTTLGGQVIYVGKPEPAIYDYCLSKIKAKRIVAIGDTLQNDIQGGHNMGLDTILTTNGVTRFTLSKSIPQPEHPDFVAYCQTMAIMPTAFLTHFVW